MDKWLLKRPRSSVESSMAPGVSATSVTNEPVRNAELDFNQEADDVVSDPALRKPIEDFEVGIRDRIRREYISKGPCQPKGHDFPKKKFGQHNRSFQSRWLEKYSWLEYSVSKDAAFCFWCYLFKPINANYFGDDVFVKVGFSNWKKALEKFNEHEGDVNSVHNAARVGFENFKNQRQSVAYSFSSHERAEEVAYRTRLTASLDVVRLLLRQGLSFRGDNESSSSLNRGNFLEFLTWYGERSAEVGAVIGKNAPANNQMISPRIQKELTNSCAVETTLAILKDIGERKFTLLVDEARDIAIKEQMAVVLRYVSKNGEVMERFLGLVHVTDTSAKSLKEGIDFLFGKHNLSLSRLRGQGYDGASNMRGEFNGLKTLILKENPSAKYIHCFAHQLQLVVVTVARNHRAVSDLFSVVSLIVNTCGGSCKRMDQLRQIEHDRVVERLESGEISSGRGLNQETSLCRPGDTRWGSHFTTLNRLQAMWPSICEVLQNVYDDGCNPDTRGLSKTLLMRMETYDFAFVLILMTHLLGLTYDLSAVLQERDQNIVQAISLIRSTKKQLHHFRENRWDDFLKEVEKFCVTNSIDVPDMEDTIKSRVRMKRDGRVTNYHHYRVEIYCEVLDLVIQEMENRFPETNTELLLCMDCLNPNNSFASFNVEKLVRLAELYPEDFTSEELMILPHQLRSYIFNIQDDEEFSTIQDLGSLAKKLVATGKARVFSLVYRLIELTLILPVATASVERVFSAMKIIKTDLRNRMGDQWMNDLLVVYFEKEIFIPIENEAILQRFQSMATRRSQLSSLDSRVS